MGQIFSVKGPGPEDPPDGEYWRKRTLESTWFLREVLLNGDVVEVCSMLKMPLPKEFEAERDTWAVFKGWLTSMAPKSNRDIVAAQKRMLPDNFNLDTYVWLDDRGHTALHYLAMGRQRTNYTRYQTRYPLFEWFPNSLPAPDTEANRVIIFDLLLTHLRVSEDTLFRKNELGANALHFLAVSNNERMLSLVRPFLSEQVLSITDDEGILDDQDRRPRTNTLRDSLRPVDLALKFSNLRIALALGLNLLQRLPDASRSLLLLPTSTSHAWPSASSGVPKDTAGDINLVALVKKNEKDKLKVQGAQVELESTLSAELLQNDGERLLAISRKEQALAEKLKVPRMQAASLLARSMFDMQRASDLFASEHPHHAPVLARDLKGSPRDETMSHTCPVCYESASERERAAAVSFRTMPCRHFVCDRCLATHARIRILDEGNLALLVCPAERCIEQLTTSTIIALFPSSSCADSVGEMAAASAPPAPATTPPSSPRPPIKVFSRDFTAEAKAAAAAAGGGEEAVWPMVRETSELYRGAILTLMSSAGVGDSGIKGKYLKLLTHAFVDASPTVSWCPAAGCDRCIMLPESATCLSIGVTCGCGATFCFACKAHVHEPASCKIWEAFCAEMETAKALGELDSSKWIRENTTACTSCAAPVSRTEGCNHMKCTRCRGEFCYACGAVWDNTHYGCARRQGQGQEDQLVSRSNEDVRAWSLGGCNRWDGVLRRQPDTYWTDLLAGFPAFSAALEVLKEAHSAVLVGASLMKHSFAIDLSIREGKDYEVARERLRIVRGELEAVVQPLSDAILPRNAQGGMDGKVDLRTPMAIAMVVASDPDAAARVQAAAASVLRRVRILSVAARAGLLTRQGHESTLADVRLGAKAAWCTTSKAFSSLMVSVGFTSKKK